MYNLIITNSKGEMTRYSLPEQNGSQVLIGRGKGCDIALTDESSLSREHLVLSVIDDNIYIQDNHSSNGLFRDSQRIDAEYMIPGKAYLAAGCSFMLVKQVAPLRKIMPKPQAAAPSPDYYSTPADAQTLKAVLEAAGCNAPSGGRPYQEQMPQEVPAEEAFYSDTANGQPLQEQLPQEAPAEQAFYSDTANGQPPQEQLPQEAPAEEAFYSDTANDQPLQEQLPQEAPAEEAFYSDTANDQPPQEQLPQEAPAEEAFYSDTANDQPPQEQLPQEAPVEEIPDIPPTIPTAVSHAPHVTVRRAKGNAAPRPTLSSVPGTILGLPCDFDLNIRLFSVREQPQGGDMLRFGAMADRLSYFYLLQYDSGGEGVLLVPGVAGEQNKLFRNIETRFPSVGEHPYDIMVEPPFGQDTVIALASSVPCDFKKLWEQCYRSAEEKAPGKVELETIQASQARYKNIKWASAVMKMTTRPAP